MTLKHMHSIYIWKYKDAPPTLSYVWPGINGLEPVSPRTKLSDPILAYGLVYLLIELPALSIVDPRAFTVPAAIPSSSPWRFPTANTPYIMNSTPTQTPTMIPITSPASPSFGVGSVGPPAGPSG